MKKILVVILIISVFGACTYRSGSGNIITETRNTGSLPVLMWEEALKVELKNGPVEVIC